jgi:hypothetical protein
MSFYFIFFLLFKVIFQVKINKNYLIMKKTLIYKIMVSFKSIDFLGKQQSLYILDSTRHRTVIGGILFSVSVLASLILSVYFIFLMLNRSTMTLLYNPKTEERPIIDFSTLPLMFTLIDKKSITIQKEGVWDFFAATLEVIPIIEQNGTVNTTQIVNNITLEPCDITKHFGNYSSYFSNNTFINVSYCIPVGTNLTFYGTYGSTSGYKFFDIFINQCVNTTNKTCIDPVVIQSKLLNVYLLISTLDYTIDHTNLENPLTIYSRSDQYPISSSLYTKYFNYYKNTKYSTDTGFIFPEISEISAIQFSDYKNFYFSSSFGTATASNSTNIGQFQFYANPITDQFTRSYMSLQTVVANIGGVVKLFIVIAIILDQFLTQKMYLCDTLNLMPELNHFYNRTEKSVSMISSSNMVTPKHPIQAHNIQSRKPIKLEMSEILCHFNKGKNQSVLRQFQALIVEKINMRNIIEMSNVLNNLKLLILNKEELDIFNQVKVIPFKTLEAFQNDVSKSDLLTLKRISQNDWKKQLSQKLEKIKTLVKD